MTQTIDLRPQPRQEVFLQNPADIVIYGGAAGGGKTWSLLAEPLRHWQNRNFGAVIFRRTMAEVIKPGGLWDEANRLYPLMGAKPNENERRFTFPAGARVTFGHLQYDATVDEWKSAQIALLEFDQLETFSEQQFFYMLSRNRSLCGVRPYVRATCNPEPGWLADFLTWWIGGDGYALPERSGKVRWMVRAGDEQMRWFDTEQQAMQAFPDMQPKSVAFVLATVFDNQVLLGRDPGYLANLKALPLVDRERLLGDAERGGNWKIKPSAGKVFNRAWFKTAQAAPTGGTVVRRWDFAATEKELNKTDPDFTASCLMLNVDRRFFVLDVTNEQLAPSAIDRYVENISRQDAARFAQEKRQYKVRWEQEPGSAGKRESFRMTQMLAGIDARGVASQKDKLLRAKPLAAQCEAGNVSLLEGQWNELYLNHMHGQPELPHDDLMDASSGAFYDLTAPEAQSPQYIPSILEMRRKDDDEYDL